MRAGGKSYKHKGRKECVFFAEFTADTLLASGVSNIWIGIGEGIGAIKDVSEFIAWEPIFPTHPVQGTGVLVFTASRCRDQHIFCQQGGGPYRVLGVDLTPVDGLTFPRVLEGGKS